MREPWFWRSRSLTARIIKGALRPAAALYQTGHKLRWKMTRQQRASVPVICIGNATLGGVGKTPFAILVERLLREQRVKSFFLTRGYGGSTVGPVLVDPERHSADEIGDEALLLAQRAPTVVSRNRPAGATLAAEKGAEAVIMDDGFQNPRLAKDLSILLVAVNDEGQSGHVFPAGPYREPVAEARKRADIIVAVVAEEARAGNQHADFYAWLEPATLPEKRRVIAFAGLGRPERFFAMLESCGFDVAGKFAFPDHHPFTARELETLARNAKNDGAALMTTEKDFIRVPEAFRDEVSVLAVDMHVSDAETLAERLASCVAAHKKNGDNNTDA